MSDVDQLQRKVAELEAQLLDAPDMMTFDAHVTMLAEIRRQRDELHESYVAAMWAFSEVAAERDALKLSMAAREADMQRIDREWLPAHDELAARAERLHDELAAQRAVNEQLIGDVQAISADYTVARAEVAAITKRCEDAEARANYYVELNRDQCSDLIAKDCDIADITKRCETLAGTLAQVRDRVDRVIADHDADSNDLLLALERIRKFSRAALESNDGRGT